MREAWRTYRGLTAEALRAPLGLHTPIFAQRIAQALGIMVWGFRNPEGATAGVRARLIVTPLGAQMYFREGESPEQMNYDCACLFWALLAAPLLAMEVQLRDDAVETPAMDAYARELLLPQPVVERLVGEGVSQSAMKRFFGVPEYAMKARLAELYK
jgi:hypothetical protein